METNRLQRTLTILLILAVLTFLVEKVLQVAALIGNTILLFALAWLVAFIVGPLVTSLTHIGAPRVTVAWVERRWGEPAAGRLDRIHLSRGFAAVLIYVGIIAVIVVAILFVAPVAATQLYQLGSGLPQYAAGLPRTWNLYETQLTRLGIAVDVPRFLSSQELVGYVQNAGTLIVQNALAIAASLATLVANLLIVLILSFYITLDGPRLAGRAVELTPRGWQDEVQLFSDVAGRMFGGFIRGQLLQAALFGAATALVMMAAGINFALLTSLAVGGLMLIPAIGPVLALLPPVFLTLIQQPGTILWVFLSLLIFQQAMINLIMPRVMSGMIGMHPLLVFAAILIGIRVAGVWGSVFGIPIAGVLASILMFFYVRLLRTGQLSGPVGEVLTPSPTRPEATASGSVVAGSARGEGAR